MNTATRTILTMRHGQCAKDTATRKTKQQHSAKFKSCVIKFLRKYISLKLTTQLHSKNLYFIKNIY